jgi:hypothetical protein
LFWSSWWWKEYFFLQIHCFIFWSPFVHCVLNRQGTFVFHCNV